MIFTFGFEHNKIGICVAINKHFLLFAVFGDICCIFLLAVAKVKFVIECEFKFLIYRYKFIVGKNYFSTVLRNVVNITVLRGIF